MYLYHYVIIVISYYVKNIVILIIRTRRVIKIALKILYLKYHYTKENSYITCVW